MVQGVGFRYFALETAERLKLAGYVRNLLDGRVEVYAMGSREQLAEFRAALARGPTVSSVTHVAEVAADWLPRYADGFVIEYTV